MKKEGLFITFEGIDGCGKTTQVALFQGFLKAQKRSCHVTREPGGTQGSEGIRHLLKDPQYAWTSEAQFFLFMAARHQHVQQVLRPLLQEGQWVVCDRFTDSTWVYQKKIRRVLGDEVFQSITCYAAAGLEPDITFVMDVAPEEAQQRMRKRTLERGGVMEVDDALDVQAIRLLRQEFLDYAQHHSHRCFVISGHLSEDEVHRQIVNVFQQWYERSYAAGSIGG